MAILGSYLRKLNVFKQTDTGIKRFPIFRNKNSHPADYYLDVEIPDNIPDLYDKENFNIRINKYEYITYSCGSGGYSQTYSCYYKIQILLAEHLRNINFWRIKTGKTSYQIIIKSVSGKKLAVFEPDYSGTTLYSTGVTFSTFTDSSLNDDYQPRYVYVDGTQYDFGASTYNGIKQVVNGSTTQDNLKALSSTTQEGYVVINDWSSQDPDHPDIVKGYIPLTTDPNMLVVYKNRKLYPNQQDSIKCQGCDNANSACTYCDSLAWYGGDCGTCNLVCFSGDECLTCYKQEDTIPVCSSCDEVSDDNPDCPQCYTSTDSVEPEEKEIINPEPTTCIVEGKSFDEGNGYIGYCIDGCVGCDSCNSTCNDEFIPATVTVECKGTADSRCTGAACTNLQTDTVDKTGTCTSCDSLSDSDSEWKDVIEDPELCATGQTSTKICIIIDSRCSGLVNTATCEGQQYAACSGVDLHVRCTGGGFESGVETDDVVKCTGIYITDGTRTECSPVYTRTYTYTQGEAHTTKTTECEGVHEEGDGYIYCKPTHRTSDYEKNLTTGECLVESENHCTGGMYGHCPGTNENCSGDFLEQSHGGNNRVKCPGNYTINIQCEQISCVGGAFDIDYEEKCDGCFGNGHGTWTECIGVACTSSQTTTEKCGVSQAGQDLIQTCTSNNGGSSSCEGGIHGVCPSNDSDNEYCSGGVYVPICKSGASISCDPCYITSYSEPCSQGSCTPCRGSYNPDECPQCYTLIYTPPCEESCSYTPCDYHPCDYNPCDYNPCEYGSCSPCRVCFGLSCASCRGGDYCTANVPSS